MARKTNNGGVVIEFIKMDNISTELLSWLSFWFYQHCDGDWEHENQIKIQTLDNPG
jgi:hypothetical protein